MRLATRKFCALLAAAVCTSAVSFSAHAATDLEIDLNNLTVQARNTADTSNVGFSTSFTGLLKLSMGTGYLNGITTYDGDDIAAEGTGALTGLTGSLSLTNGVVTGGNLSVTVTTAGNPQTFSVNSTTSPANAITSPAPYSVSGDADLADFSSNSFGGLDISEFFSVQPLSGSFVVSHYTPGTGASLGKSTVSNLDVLVSVPEPGSLALVAGGIGLMSMRRRSASAR